VKETSAINISNILSHIYKFDN